jgi:diacylglycerol kinase family enzyme
MEATRTPGDLEPALARLQSRDVDTLAVVGGDGTITWTLTALLRTWCPDNPPALLLIPGGTVNTIPASVGVRGRADRVLEGLIDSGGAMVAYPRSVLRISADGKEPRWGMIFGNGLVSRWLARYNARARNGLLGAISEVTRAVGSAALGGPYARTLLAPFEAEVEVNGETMLLDRFTGMAAGALRHIGFGFQPFLSIPDEGRVGQFHWITTDAGGLEVVLDLPALRLGVPSPFPSLRHAAAQSVQVRLAEPQPYTIDGDLFPPACEFRVDVGPALPFAQPI